MQQFAKDDQILRDSFSILSSLHHCPRSYNGRSSTSQIFTQADLIECESPVSSLERKMCAWGIQRSSEKIQAANTIPRDFLPANTSGKAACTHSKQDQVHTTWFIMTKEQFQFAEKLEQNPFGSLHDLIIEALAKGIWIKLSPSRKLFHDLYLTRPRRSDALLTPTLPNQIPK